MNACIVIPFYNHGGAITQVVTELAVLGLPCRIVDDGSDAVHRAVLEDIAAIQGVSGADWKVPRR